MRSKSILFVYPPITNETRKSLESNSLNGSMLSPEISFLYLEAYLREKIPGIEIELVDFRVEDAGNAERILENHLNAGRFNFVGITCYSQHYLPALAIARVVKKINKDIVTIVGGFHPTIVPGDFTFPGSPVDHVIRGEGEISLYQLVSRGAPVPPSPRVVNGIPLDNLDEVPPFTLNLIEKYKHDMNVADLAVYFSRGCTFDCSFCISREDTCGLKRYRLLSPAKARAQLDILEAWAPRCITISDSLFCGNQKWFDSVTAMIQAEQRPYKVKVEAHVDTLSDQKLRALIRGGIDLTIGFENASPQQLVLMNKTLDPIRYVKRMREIIETFFGSGRELVINLLVGHPGENKRTIDETFGFLDETASKLDSTLLKFSLFRLYPGTPIYRNVKFFEDVFGTIFYLKDWWYHDVDHSLYPSIIDPSRNLDLISEISYIRDKINSFYQDLLSRVDFSSITYKLALTRHLSRVNTSYVGLHERMAGYRKALPSNDRRDGSCNVPENILNK